MVVSVAVDCDMSYTDAADYSSSVDSGCTQEAYLLLAQRMTSCLNVSSDSERTR